MAWPDTGIAVAINRTPLKYKSGAFNDDGTLSETFMDDLRLWVNDHRDLLDEYDGMLWIGGWAGAMCLVKSRPDSEG